MPNNNFEHIIHKHSSVVTNGNPKLPTTSQIEYGEIAVNYAKDHETISLKNSNNEIVTFSTDEAIKKIINDDAYVISNSLNDLNSRIGAVEDRKMDKINGTSSQFVKGDGSLDSNAYAPKASPALTGTPTAPTASSGTNTTQIATTAFVSNAISGKVDKVSSSTDNAIVRFDGTSGGIQNSGVTINDSNHLTATKLITSGGTSSQFVKGDGSLDSNTYAGAQTSGGAANKAVSIPFGQVDSTSTSTAFTATVDGITELRDGVCVYLKNGVVTSAASCTLNVNGLGAKPIYSSQAATTRVTYTFNINYTDLFVYNSSRVEGGCWDLFYGYNSDTNTRGYEIIEYYSGNKKVKTACQRNQIMLTCMDGYLLPVYSGTYTTGTSKILTTEKFNPNGQVYYYGATGILEANATPANGTLFTQAAYNFADLRYSFNTGTTLIAGNDIYLVCVPQNDGSAILHTSPIAFALPSTEDGLIYKRLGKAHDTYRLSMEQDKPCYYYKNGSINLWTGTGTQTDVSKAESSSVIDIGGYDLMKINEVKGKSLVWNQLAPDSAIVATGSTRSYADGYTTMVLTNETSQVRMNNSFSQHLHAGDKIIVLSHVKLYNVANATFDTLSVKTIWNATQSKIGYSTSVSYISGDVIGAYITVASNVLPTDSIGFYFDLNNGSSFTHTTDDTIVASYNIFNLTQMFGAGNEPTTVEKFRQICSLNQYMHNTGEVVGNNVEKLDVTGFNIWNEEWEVGRIDNNTGQDSEANTNIRTKGYVEINANSSYCYTNLSSYKANIYFYDASKNFLSFITPTLTDKYKTFTTPKNAAFLRLFVATDYGTTYNHDICINKSNTSKNGTYEPYKHSEFPLNLTELTGKVNGEGTSVTIFHDGLHGVGTAFDSLIVDDDGYARRAVKRIGSRAYASGDESDTSVITDNTNTFYPLATPIEYVLDTPVQCVAKVYPNGTVKQVPVMPDSTPMVMDVTYFRDNGGMISRMMNKLASLEARIAALEGG